MSVSPLYYCECSRLACWAGEWFKIRRSVFEKMCSTFKIRSWLQVLNGRWVWLGKRQSHCLVKLFIGLEFLVYRLFLKIVWLGLKCMWCVKSESLSLRQYNFMCSIFQQTRSLILPNRKNLTQLLSLQVWLFQMRIKELLDSKELLCIWSVVEVYFPDSEIGTNRQFCCRYFNVRINLGKFSKINENRI